MCEWCTGPVGALPDVAFVDRPAQRLLGRYWEGTHEAAAAGAAVALLTAVQAEIAASGRWGGPIVGISWATGRGRVRAVGRGGAGAGAGGGGGD